MKSTEIQLASKDMMTIIIQEDTQPIDIEVKMTTMKTIIIQESIMSQEIETMMIIMKGVIDHHMMITGDADHIKRIITDLGMKGVIISQEGAMTGTEEVITIMMIDTDILIVIMFSEELMMLLDKLTSILEEINNNQLTKNKINLLNKMQNLVKFNLKRVRIRIMPTFIRERKMKIQQRILI